MLRWGVLGTAMIAEKAVGPGIVNSKNGTLVAIASRSAEKAKAIAQKLDVPQAFGSYDAVLERDDVDAVYIPLPTSHHVEWALKAMRAGKHVLVEKPLAMTADQIDKLIELREQTGLVISEAFSVYYHPKWHKVRELLAQKAIGNLRHVQAAVTYHIADPLNVRNKLELGGGGLRDVGVYPTMLTRFVTGKEPHKAQARIERHPEFGTDIFANCALEFDGFELNFYVATQLAARQSFVFHGDKGYIELSPTFDAGLDDPENEVVLNLQIEGTTQKWSYAGSDPYQFQVEAFADHVPDRSADLFSLEQSKANQKAIDALFVAAETGGWAQV